MTFFQKAIWVFQLIYILRHLQTYNSDHPMAEALVQVVLENLNSLIQREIGLLWGVDKEMENLSSTLTTIKAVLEDAVMKQLQDKAIKIWLRKLKHAAYEVDDVLDECATEAARFESRGQVFGPLSKVRASFLACYCRVDNILFCYKIGKKMKDIKEKLDAIAQERRNFHLHDVVVTKRVGIPEWRQTSSILTRPEVYGRENDKESIVEQLVNQVSDCKDVSILPIIGIGGLGKTTLAQLVFNDESVIEHFELKIWVCVSEDFEVKRIVKSIIESLSGQFCEDLDLDPLQRQLREKLTGKRYLLVLDDVWNINQEKWDKLKSVVACGSRGASIITTTRLENVALILGTLPIYRLLGLSEDDCWSLFKQQAFGPEREECPNLVAIGMEIVKKCKGVPLAAKTLGSLMRWKGGENEWHCVKESEIWNLPQDENSILPALRLSYHNLPSECRQCFAYCAIFLKGYRIEKENLIHLWMANGFISTNGRMELEEIGNDIWNELYSRSFFQEVLMNDDFGNVQSFKMHDLVHDLAQSIMEDECHVMEVGRSNNISNRTTRHVTSVYDTEELKKVESLRTLFVHSFSCDIMKFSTLRVLDASDTRITELPSSIGNLIHLRYLNLSSTWITSLPESLCMLLNLQTLKLNHCWEFQRLPKCMRCLTSLRHLFMEDCHLTQFAPKIGQLIHLKTLSLFIVDRKRGFQLCELKGLNLGGRLRIEHLERVGNWVDAGEANLVGKQKLYSLGLNWGLEGESEVQENVEQVLEALQPHPKLKELIIEEYRGTSFPLWMRNTILKDLVRIELNNCKNCPNLPPYGRLPSLRHLKISGMKYVKYIDDGTQGGATITRFQSLETLEINRLPCLERLSREEGRDVFPSLFRLSISSCPNLTLPCLTSVKDLQVSGNSNVLLSLISKLSCLTSLDIRWNDGEFPFPDGMLQNLTALQSLKIERFTKLRVLPTELSNLSALMSLTIETCNELESLPEQGLQGLNSLRNLELRDCRKLKSLSEGLQHLKSLECLIVWEYPELIFLPEGIKHLRSLKQIKISGNPKLVVLPEALQHVHALQSLSITRHPELASLPDWLGNLTSLQCLDIWECPKVASLPNSIQCLSNLTTLTIVECAGLKRQCEKGKGEDWYKIAHVPKVILKSW